MGKGYEEKYCYFSWDRIRRNRQSENPTLLDPMGAFAVYKQLFNFAVQCSVYMST